MCFCASADVKAVLPLATLVVFSLVILLLDLFKLRSARLVWTVSACLSSWAVSWPLLSLSSDALGGLMRADAYSFIFYSMILLGTLLTFLLNNKKLVAQGVEDSFDVDFLVLLAAAGGMVMVSAANLIVLFLGFEMLSVSVYVLSGLARKEKASAESAMKYFILGAFGSAFLLYGMSLVYGATGSMSLSEMFIADPNNLLLVIGLGLMIFGFGFKASLVPFHFWTPDVYQGAPTAISGFMATVVKASAFGAFIRLMFTVFASVPEIWTGVLWIIAVLSMSFANLVALRQRSIKRMLAYSSIAHAGYVLLGVLSPAQFAGAESSIYYLLVYTFMTLGAFGVVLIVTAGSNAQYDSDNIESFSNLGWTNPCLGLMMSVFLLSLAGIPPLAGFVAKFYLFSAALQSGFVGLAVIAAINSVISLYYYLRVIVVMYFAKATDAVSGPSIELGFSQKLALNIACVFIVLLGLFSELPYSIAQAAARSLGN